MSIQLEHWYQWKELCAIPLCDETAQMEIKTLLKLLTQKRLYSHNPERPGIARTPSLMNVEDAPVLFDTHCSRLVQGSTKFHKEWMMDAIDTEVASETEKLRVCNRRASGVLKNALEHFLRAENNFSNSRKALFTSSLDQTLDTGSGKVSVRDSYIERSNAFLGIRPDEGSLSAFQPSSELEMEEYRQMAEAEARELLETLPEKYLKVAFAMGVGVPMTHEGLQDGLDISQGTLYEWRKGYGTAVMERISAKYPEDGKEEHFLLASMTMQHLQELLLMPETRPSWGNDLLALLEEK